MRCNRGLKPAYTGARLREESRLYKNKWKGRNQSQPHTEVKSYFSFIIHWFRGSILTYFYQFWSMVHCPVYCYCARHLLSLLHRHADAFKSGARHSKLTFHWLCVHGNHHHVMWDVLWDQVVQSHSIHGVKYRQTDRLDAFTLLLLLIMLNVRVLVWIRNLLTVALVSHNCTWSNRHISYRSSEPSNYVEMDWYSCTQISMQLVSRWKQVRMFWKVHFLFVYINMGLEILHVNSVSTLQNPSSHSVQNKRFSQCNFPANYNFQHLYVFLLVTFVS